MSESGAAELLAALDDAQGELDRATLALGAARRRHTDAVYAHQAALDAFDTWSKQTLT